MLNCSRRIRFGRAGEAPPDRLVEGDNLLLLAALEVASLDAIYLDPPFGTGSRQRSSGASYGDPLADPQIFTSWLEPRLAHCHRVLAPSGSLFVHLDHRSVHYVKILLDQIFGRGRFVNEIIWCYSVGGKSQRRFARKHDTILWYGRSADYAFYPEAVRVPRKPSSHMRRVRDPSGALVQEKTDRKSGKIYRYPLERGKLPEDWWTDIETLNRGDRERNGWPTQKPERLIERLLSAVTAPGDRVGDFFCGSGTTAAVAQRLERSFIAADLEPEAIDRACARLEENGARLLAAGAPPPDLCLERPASS